MLKSKVILLLIILSFCLLGCQKDYSTKKWSQETFFEDKVYVPDGTVDQLKKDYDENGKETYTAIINKFTYDDFYEYIMALESEGFHYEFLNEYVPETINKLSDKTETSWTGSKGDIYIIANWRSDDNVYYNGYNLQLIFYNYDIHSAENNLPK